MSGRDVVAYVLPGTAAYTCPRCARRWAEAEGRDLDGDPAIGALLTTEEPPAVGIACDRCGAELVPPLPDPDEGTVAACLELAAGRVRRAVQEGWAAGEDPGDLAERVATAYEAAGCRRPWDLGRRVRQARDPWRELARWLPGPEVDE